MSYVTFLSAILWRDMKHVVCKKYKSEPKLCWGKVITESNNTEMYLEKCSGMFYMHQACVTVSGVWVQDLSRAYQLVSTHHPGDPFHPCLTTFVHRCQTISQFFQILHFMTRLLHTDWPTTIALGRGTHLVNIFVKFKKKWWRNLS